MAVTHNAAVTLASLQISISAEEIHNLGLDRMRKQRMRSIPQDFGELIGKCSWLNQLRDGIVRHGISLLQWRSGGVKHPHDMPPYRFTPSPTFAHSSASGTSAVAPKDRSLSLSEIFGRGARSSHYGAHRSQPAAQASSPPSSLARAARGQNQAYARPRLNAERVVPDCN